MNTSDSTSGETELGRHLLSMVDACFEEGQYESALSILEQLCSDKFKPHPPYVRQLICMALYPAEASLDNTFNIGPDLQSSPSKFWRHSRAPILPPPHSAAMAQRILVSYAVAYPPEMLFRALPGFHQDPDDFLINDEDTDSVIADEALGIKQCKTVWQILHPNFKSRTKPTTQSARGRGSRHKGELPNAEDDSPVSDNAWAVLEWLIILFERDERQNGATYSPFLLQQIPIPRGDHVARWDTDAPLDIAFFCLRQSNVCMKNLGTRLLRLMISLTSTPQIDSHMLVARVQARLAAFSCEELDSILPDLGTGPTALRFKVALCMKYVADRNTQQFPRNKAQSHRPRSARPVRVSDRGQDAQLNSKPNTSRHQTTLPTGADVLFVLLGQPADTSDEVYSRLKFELVLDFLALRKASAEQDHAWNILSVEQGIKDAFKERQHEKYLIALTSVLQATVT